MKKKEEQDEKLATHKNYQAKLQKQQAAAEASIHLQITELEKLNAQIIQAKEDQEKANNEKIKLDTTTQTLQKEKDDETKAIEQYEQDKAENRENLNLAEQAFIETAERLNKIKASNRAESEKLK